MSARIAKQNLPRPPIKNKAKKSRTHTSHLAFVRSLPCLKCGAPAPSEAMHVRNGSDGGAGLKPNDKYTVPGCRACHAEQHQKGEGTFWGRFDPLDVSLRLWAISGDEDRQKKGEDLIFSARQRLMLNGG